MKVKKLLLTMLLVACMMGMQLFMCACTKQKTARVVVLLGQSNMEGTSYTAFLRDKAVSEAKYKEYLSGYEDVQISYTVPWNPAQSSHNTFVPTALGQGGEDNRFGSEVGIAEYLSDKGYRSVFLVKYSYGGTSLFENWRSPSSGGQTGTLYTGAVEYVLSAMKVLEDMGYRPVIDAICWMQGESDADKTQGVANQYYDLQKRFIADLRKDLAEFGHEKGIGFVDAGISDCSLWKYQKTVNDAKYSISQLDELNSYFSTIEARLEYSNEPSYGADIAHYDSSSEIKLGHLFGQNLEKYLSRK